MSDSEDLPHDERTFKLGQMVKVISNKSKAPVAIGTEAEITGIFKNQKGAKLITIRVDGEPVSLVSVDIA